MTEKELYEIIRKDQMPIWTLYLPDKFSGLRLLGKYNGENCPKEATDAQKMEYSVDALDNRLKLFGTGKFLVEIASKRTSNGTGIQGPYEIEYNISSGAHRDLGGFNFQQEMNPFNYLTREIDLARREIAIEYEKKELERKNIELEDAVKELKQEAETYQPDLGKVIKDNISDIKELVDIIFNGRKKENEKLGNNQEITEDVILINKIADYILEAEMTIPQLKKLEIFINKFIEKENGNNVRLEDKEKQTSDKQEADN